MKHSFKPSGVCAARIDFELDENNVIRNVFFQGGCSGNSKGMSALVEGMTAEDAINRLKGIPCRNGTSCPDQLSKALTQALSAVDGEK